jgi:hypothetical protein
MVFSRYNCRGDVPHGKPLYEENIMSCENIVIVTRKFAIIHDLDEDPNKIINYLEEAFEQYSLVDKVIEIGDRKIENLSLDNVDDEEWDIIQYNFVDFANELDDDDDDDEE